MARSMQDPSSLLDDLDGSPGAESVVFALDDRAYEIDLSAANAAQLRVLLAPYVKAGRYLGGRGVDPSRYRSELARMRAWGRQNGWQLADRGPLPKDLVHAYKIVHNIS